jgi:hypothetical protein
VDRLILNRLDAGTVFLCNVLCYSEDVVKMEKKNKYTTLKKQDLLDKLTELATLLSAGRRIDPNSSLIKNQLEAIQVELETRRISPGPHYPGEETSK